MAKKEYTSGTQVCVNVVMKSGKSRHVSFMPLSNGGSMFITEDKDLQHALEHHYRFGKLFKCKDIEDEQPEEEPATEPQGAGREPAAEPLATVAGCEPVVKTFTDRDTAKEWLAETFKVSRSKVRTKAQQDEFAKAHNLILVISKEAAEQPVEPTTEGEGENDGAEGETETNETNGDGE